MRALALTLPALVLAALLSCTPEVSAARVPAATLADQTSNRRGASSQPAAAEQPTRKAASDDAAAASSARASRLADASASWKAPAVAGGASYSPPPSAVFDPDRMSKRRVRRGSDPIHNKC